MIDSKFSKNYIPELKRILLGYSKPTNVSINLTDKCNQQCIYCEIGSNSTSNSSNLLTKEDLFWIISQMSEQKMTKLSMCGGEPFLFTGIIDVVDFAWKKNIYSFITSNGMIVHQLSENDFVILKKCKTVINISIDSFNDQIQSKTRGNKNALSNAIKSIKKLQENNIPVIVLSVITKYNFSDLYKSLLSAYEIGIKNVLYQPVIKFSNFPDRKVISNKSEINISPDQIGILYSEFEKIVKFERKHNINTNIYRLLPWIEEYIKYYPDKNKPFFFNNVIPKFYCREVFTVIDIDYYGGIQPCGLLLSQKSIKDNKNIDLLVQWEEATKKLKNDLRKFNYPQNCNGCSHKFSRNLFASALMRPITNRRIFLKISILILNRFIYRILKKLLLKKK